MTPKLLLADDSVTIQRVIELTFADEDVQVLAVGDGQQAIDRLKTERPDIVLADVGMPERDGYEVAAFIKGDPQLAHIPVLLLTGAFEPIDEAKARAVGCDGVLVKPFEPQMVISRVRDLLSGDRTAGVAPARSGAASAAGQMVRSEPAKAVTSEATGGSLEDYFDRLDAALANKTAPPAPAPEIIPRVAAPTPHASPPKPVPATVAASTAPPVPVVAAAAAAQAPATPSAPAAPHAWDMPSLQDAFAALLSAEQGQPIASTATRPGAVSDDIIDEIVNRVIARLGDESMRSAVLDVAERLVREEIARIKAQH